MTQLLIADDAGNYTDSEILTQIQQDFSVVKFRYQHLNYRNEPIRWLTCVNDSTSIHYNFFADIKRTAEFELEEGEETAGIKFHQDRIMPFMAIKMPDGLYAYRPLGVFLLNSPTREVQDGRVTRRIKGFDQTVILTQRKISDRLKYAGTDIIITKLYELLKSLGFSQIQLHGYPSLPTTFGTERSWDPGTTYAKIVGDIIEKLGLASLYFDPVGTVLVTDYIIPSGRPINVTYKTDRYSIIEENLTEELELFDVSNKWVLVKSQPDSAYMVATVVNNEPTDPTSVVSRGFEITDYRTSSDAADQAALDQQVRKIASEAAQLYRKVTFSTALNPLHGEATTVKLEHGPSNITDVYSETKWDMKLVPGGTMKHEARLAVKTGELAIEAS